MNWTEKQAENRRLLEEAAKTRKNRNLRDAVVDPETALQGVLELRAKVIGNAVFRRCERITEAQAAGVALELLRIRPKTTDEQLIAELCEKYPARVPKTKAEIETPVQQSLIDAPARRLHFVLPYPPSANRYWKHAAVFSKDAGRWIATTYVSEEAKTYKEIIRVFCKKHNIKPLLCDVKLTAYVYRPQRSGDLGNRLKVVEDALENIAYLNDSQIAESHHYRREDKARPRVEVFLEEIK